MCICICVYILCYPHNFDWPDAFVSHFSMWLLKCASEPLAWIDAGSGCTATESRSTSSCRNERFYSGFFRWRKCLAKTSIATDLVDLHKLTLSHVWKRLTEVSHFKLTCHEIEFRILSKLFRPTCCHGRHGRDIYRVPFWGSWFHLDFSVRWVQYCFVESLESAKTNRSTKQTHENHKLQGFPRSESIKVVSPMSLGPMSGGNLPKGPWLAPLPWLEVKKRYLESKKSYKIIKYEAIRNGQDSSTFLSILKRSICHLRMKRLVLCFGHLWRRYLKCMRLWPRLLAKMTAK